MTRRIDILDGTAERLARLQALTGQSVNEVLDSALRAQLAHVETEALRVAVQLGGADADAGAFTEHTVEEIFAEGMERAKRAASSHD